MMKCSPRNESNSGGLKPGASSSAPRSCKWNTVAHACCWFHTIGGIVKSTKTPSIA